MTDSADNPTSPENGADGPTHDAVREPESAASEPTAGASAPASAPASTTEADTVSVADADPAATIESVAQAAPPQFAELQPDPGAGGQASLAMLHDLMMPVSVELGRTAMSVRDVLGLGRGSVIPLNRLAGEPIDIYVSDRKLAEGEVVVLGDHFGVRLTRVLPASGAAATPELQAQGA